MGSIGRGLELCRALLEPPGSGKPPGMHKLTVPARTLAPAHYFIHRVTLRRGTRSLMIASNIRATGEIFSLINDPRGRGRRRCLHQVPCTPEAREARSGQEGMLLVKPGLRGSVSPPTMRGWGLS